MCHILVGDVIFYIILLRLEKCRYGKHQLEQCCSFSEAKSTGHSARLLLAAVWRITSGTAASPLSRSAMPICIECRYPVKTLYTEYSGADDKSSGHGVRLTVCKNCGRFCDKYVEHDFVVLFIDLVLIKPQVCSIPLALEALLILPGLQTPPPQYPYAGV